MQRDSRLWQNSTAVTPIFDGDPNECSRWVGFATTKLKFMLSVRPGPSSETLTPVDGVEIHIDARPNKIRIKAGKKLYVWGYNAYYQLGFGDTTPRLAPTVLKQPFDAVWFTQTSMFANRGNKLYVCGANSNGVFGTGSTTDIHVPTQIKTDCLAYAASITHSLRINTSKELYACGLNNRGQLGIGSVTADMLTEQYVGSGYVYASCGEFVSFAIKENGDLYGFGLNTSGELGIGTTVNVSTPTLIGSGYMSVTTGPSGHTLALKADGTLLSCGYNHFGQLGLGDIVSRNVFTSVGAGYKGIAVNTLGSYALKTDGSLYYFGLTILGEAHSPSLIATGVKYLSAGYNYATYIKINGEMYSFGNNGNGQLGTNDYLDRSAPTLIGSGFKKLNPAQTPFSTAAFK